MVDDVLSTFSKAKDKMQQELILPRNIMNNIDIWKHKIDNLRTEAKIDGNLLRTFQSLNSLDKDNVKGVGIMFSDGLKKLLRKIHRQMLKLYSLADLHSKELKIKNYIWVEKKANIEIFTNFDQLFEKLFNENSASRQKILQSEGFETYRDRKRKEDDLLNLSNLGVTLLDVTDLYLDRPAERLTSLQNEENELDNILELSESNEDLLKSLDFGIEIEERHDRMDRLNVPQANYILHEEDESKAPSRLDKLFELKNHPSRTGALDRIRSEFKGTHSTSPSKLRPTSIPKFGRSSKKIESVSRASRSKSKKQAEGGESKSPSKMKKLFSNKMANITSEYRPSYGRITITGTNLPAENMKPKAPYLKSFEMNSAKLPSKKNQRKDPNISKSVNSSNSPDVRRGKKSGSIVNERQSRKVQQSHAPTQDRIVLSEEARNLYQQLPSKDTIPSSYHYLLVNIIDGIGSEFDFSNSGIQ